MKRTVIVLWKGHSWYYESIDVPSGLSSDLPLSRDFRTHDTGKSHPFVLAGDCAGDPIYIQAD